MLKSCHARKINLEKVRASLDAVCPKCGSRFQPQRCCAQSECVRLVTQLNSAVRQGGQVHDEEKPINRHDPQRCILLHGVTLAQEPVEDINKNIHPDLAAAQHHVVQTDSLIIAAQKNNKDDMQGHAEKARDLLAQANRELKLAAEAASAAAAAASPKKK